MKCPKCEELGLRSGLYLFAGLCTLMCTDHYFDEDDKEHFHDPNWTKESWYCSLGHTGVRYTRLGCSACGKETEVDIRVNEVILGESDLLRIRADAVS